jgi:hypothetical protein
MSKSTWTGADGSDWFDADNWSPAGVPGASSDVTIATGEAVASASIGTVNSITDSSWLSFKSAGTNTITGSVANSGLLFLDGNEYDPGGSTLSIGGALTNTGEIEMGNAWSGASDKLTAGALSNSGSINLEFLALLDVTTGVAGFGTAGTLTGSVTVRTASAIEFPSGQISTIATGASLQLNANDGSAFIEDSTALGSNSALTGLTDIAGSLFLDGDVSVSTTGSVTDSGSVDLYRGASLSTKSFVIVNSGTVGLYGGHLNVSGATTNNGYFLITEGKEELAGAVGGAGSIKLKNAKLRFDTSVSAGQIITEHGADALVLEQAQSFAATIKGFGTGDTITAANFLLSGTTKNFVENTAGTGGTLTLHDGGLTAHILMIGVYSNFRISPSLPTAGPARW